MSLKKISKQIFSYLVGYKSERSESYLVYFNGECIGYFWGRGLFDCKIEYFMNEYPGLDCEPIQLVEVFEVF